jgi:hypothetical protein
MQKEILLRKKGNRVMQLSTSKGSLLGLPGIHGSQTNSLLLHYPINQNSKSSSASNSSFRKFFGLLLMIICPALALSGFLLALSFFVRGQPLQTLNEAFSTVGFHWAASTIMLTTIFGGLGFFWGIFLWRRDTTIVPQKPPHPDSIPQEIKTVFTPLPSTFLNSQFLPQEDAEEEISAVITAVTTILNLSQQNLKEIPILTFTQLRLKTLDVSSNHLAALPEEIGSLRNLTELSLFFNKIETMPDSLKNLKNLRRLEVSYNRLRLVPEAVCELTNLGELTLDNNRLKSLPENISYLENLTKLSLSHNQLTVLPESIRELFNLTELSLRNNLLTSLPAGIGHLKNLKMLDLSLNPLNSIPVSLTELPKLETLLISANQQKLLPQGLNRLQVDVIVW